MKKTLITAFVLLIGIFFMNVNNFAQMKKFKWDLDICSY